MKKSKPVKAYCLKKGGHLCVGLVTKTLRYQAVREAQKLCGYVYGTTDYKSKGWRVVRVTVMED